MSNPYININIGGYAKPTDYIYKTVNLKNNLSFAAQVNTANCKYIVKYNFDLEGESIAIPENCLLEFDGGTVSNGTLIGQDTIIIYHQDRNIVLPNVVFEGSWTNGNVVVDDETIEKDGEELHVKDNGIKKNHLNDNVVDDEDLCLNSNRQLQFKNKAYNPDVFSGLGRTYLRKNIQSVHIKQWLCEKIGNTVYLFYSDGNRVYAIYDENTGKGLVLVNHIVAELRDYDTIELPEDIVGNYLSYTEEGGVYTITLPDESTITNTELNQTEIYYYTGGVTVNKNILAQDMINNSDTVYIIQYDYDLNGETITVPAGCVLMFIGGSLSNGTLVGTDTCLMYCGLKSYILKVTFSGTFTDNYYTKNEIDGFLTYINGTIDKFAEGVESRTNFGIKINTVQRVAPNDYEKGAVFYVVEEPESEDVIRDNTYYIAKNVGSAGDDLEDTNLFESTKSVIDASNISANIKFSEVEELENYYNKTEIDEQTAVNRNIATIMALSALPPLLEEITVSSNPEYKLVYTDSQQGILLAKRQDNSWYYPNNLDAVIDSLIDRINNS